MNWKIAQALGHDRDLWYIVFQITSSACRFEVKLTCLVGFFVVYTHYSLYIFQKMCTLGSRGILESQMFNKCKIFLGPSFQSFCLLDKSWVFCCCGSSSSWATTTAGAGAASSLSKAFWVFCLVIGTIENYTQNEENTHLGRSIGFPHPTLPYYTHIGSSNQFKSRFLKNQIQIVFYRILA